MRRVFLGGLSLTLLLAFSTPAALAARSHVPAKTINDLSDAIPLGVLERSVGQKFYRSLLRSPLDDWAIVRARMTGARLSGARVIRGAKNPAYNSLALKWANELTLVATDASGNAGRGGSAIMHLLIYQIADGAMAFSFAYPEPAPGQQMRNLGTVRLSVKTKQGPWTEISPPDSRGPRLRRIDRMPMDVITVPRP